MNKNIKWKAVHCLPGYCHSQPSGNYPGYVYISFLSLKFGVEQGISSSYLKPTNLCSPRRFWIKVGHSSRGPHIISNTTAICYVGLSEFFDASFASSLEAQFMHLQFTGYTRPYCPTCAAQLPKSCCLPWWLSQLDCVYSQMVASAKTWHQLVWIFFP